MKTLSIMLAVTTELGVIIVLGVFSGNFLDQKLHSAPWGILLGSFLGLGIGFYRLFIVYKTKVLKN